MGVSIISEAVNQVASFMSNQASQGILKGAGTEEPKEEGQLGSAVVKDQGILQGSESEAYKVTISAEAMSKHSILSAS